MTTNKWVSPIAEQFDQSPRDTKDQKLPALRIVVHITGRSTYLNAEKRKVAPLQHLGEYFDRRGRPFAHYSVDPWGRIACHAPETETPYAQGWKDYGGRSGLLSKITSGELEVPQWWQIFWGLNDTVATPASLVPADAYSGNDRSVTIEFIQWGNQYRLTVAQYVWGSILVDDIARRHDINKTDPRCILGHEDLDPWARGDAVGGWDPGARRGTPRFSYDALFTPSVVVGTPTCIATPPVPDWAR